VLLFQYLGIALAIILYVLISIVNNIQQQKSI
jgi:hypothetical protein